MQQFITVDTAMAELILHSPRKVEIRDPSGKCIAHAAPDIHGVSPETIAIALERRKMNEPEYSTREVIQYLESLKTGAPVNE